MARSLGQANEVMLLDTHALIWLARGQGLSASAQSMLSNLMDVGWVYVSAVSAWEVGNLSRTKGLLLLPDPGSWFEQVTAAPSIRVISLDAPTALAATNLPGAFHKDPADRFLVATARALDVPILTRDELILAYAAAGHVRAVAC